MLRIDKLSLRYGNHIIFDDCSVRIHKGERVCIIGRNGSGKSTLMNIIHGSQTADEVEMVSIDHLVISKLDQQLPEDIDLSVEDYLNQGLAEQHQRILRFQQLSANPQTPLSVLEKLQTEIEANGGWSIQQRIDSCMTQFNLPKKIKLSQLSGGWRRHAALAKAMISEPDLLLLDEPTNHLDFEAISRLENRLRNYPGAILFVTHDREFLRQLATRIIEIDRTRIINWPGNYDRYLELKQQTNLAEDTQNNLFDKRLKQEEEWIRQGIKARRTRNEGRVRALEEMRQQAQQRLKRQPRAVIKINQAEASSKKIFDLHKIRYRIANTPIIDGLSLRIMRGDRVGIIGNNGVGKSTLLQIMLGEIQPSLGELQGQVKQGNNLHIAYFSQHQHPINLNKSVAYNVNEGSDYIPINGGSQHVIGYLKNFLFTPERSQTQVKLLSGGEQNRVMLAKLFAQPSNVLILDEPTNDLDIEMLESLEHCLQSYQGTVIIVSHDRQFLDQVVTSTLVFEEHGLFRYPGGYADWHRKQKQLANHPYAVSRRSSEANHSAQKDSDPMRHDEPNNKKLSNKLSPKLSYKLQRELDQLPQQIECLEKQLLLAQEPLNQVEFYEQPYQQQQQQIQTVESLQRQLDQLNERWIQLEEA